MKKLDIMNTRDQVAPGETCKWQMVKGKVAKIEETPDITPKEEPKPKPIEKKVIGPVVKEAITEIVVKEKKSVKKEKEVKKENDWN